ncbi:MAG: ribonuclease J [Desulfobacterales bacterium]
MEDFPDSRIIIITTGSQGEPMSALARMSTGIHKQIRIRQGDTVILSSKFIPGNEKAIAKIINNLYRRGADVIYEKISAIHVSGHAFREELKLMINLTRPRYFIPIHGEYRHLVLHARLAEDMGIPRENVLLAENGQVIEFDENGGRIRESIPTGRILVDGKGIGDVGMSLLKERRALSEDGFVAVTLAFDEETGIVMYGPEIISRGFVFENETGHLLDDAICVVLEAIEDIGPDTKERIEKIRARIQGDLRKYFNFTIRRKPVILPFIVEV